MNRVGPGSNQGAAATRSSIYKEKGVFSCELCGATYSHYRNLISHRKAHTGETYCLQCNKNYSNKQGFMKHLVMCHGYSTSQLAALRSPFFPMSDRRRALSSWKVWKTTEVILWRITEVILKAFKCTVRLEKVPVYSSQRGLSLKIDDGPKLNVCFQETSSLIAGISPKRNFACNFCNASYTQYRNLKAHQKCHTGETHCFKCNKTYMDKTGLRKHNLLQHSDHWTKL
nr:PREDICTED: zinc finger protein 585A-like [Bemisia tabaci]